MLIRYVKQVTILTVLLLGTVFNGWGVQIATAGDAIPQTAPTQEEQPLPMSDAAVGGLGCMTLATPVLAAAYAVGPTEIMMLVSGAVIVPSSSPQLLVALGGILGGAACGIGASLTPAVVWATNELASPETVGPKSSANSSIEAKEIAVADDPNAKDKAGDDKTAEAPAPIDENFVQSTGCAAGIIALSAIALATAPIEIVGLAAGGVGVPTNTSILLLAMTGTVVPAGCTIGAAASLPMLALSQNLGLDAIGRGLYSMLGWDKSASLAPSVAPYVSMDKQKSGTATGVSSSNGIHGI